MSVARRLGVVGDQSHDFTGSCISQSSRVLLQQILNDCGFPIADYPKDGNESTSSLSCRPSSPGGYNSNLYSPQRSPYIRVNVASPAPSSGAATPASYAVLPALTRSRRYVVTGTLQQSLFGVVKLAFDRERKVQVAIKISRRERVQQQQSRNGVSVLENVRREAAVMRYLHERSASAQAGHSSAEHKEKLALHNTNDFSDSSSGKEVKPSSRALQHLKPVEEQKSCSLSAEGSMIKENMTMEHDETTRKGSDTYSIQNSDSEIEDTRVKQLGTSTGDVSDAEGEKYICKFTDELEDEYFHYLITEFVPAGDLYSTLISYPEHRLTESQGRGLFRQMVLGIKYLHERNVAHLDLSLENICLDAEDNIRVIDFGVAVVHSLTSTSYSSANAYFSFPSASTLLPCSSNCSATRSFICKPVQDVYAKPGKIRYMSPELFQGLAWDAYANDVFALGVILYSLLTGRPAFQRAELSDVWFQVMYTGQWLTTEIRRQPSARVYAHLSEGALDLMNKILKPQQVRPTCEQILQHPWMLLKQ